MQVRETYGREIQYPNCRYLQPWSRGLHASLLRIPCPNWRGITNDKQNEMLSLQGLGGVTELEACWCEWAEAVPCARTSSSSV